MMNTDLMHMLHHQRHQRLWAEAERERAARDCAGVTRAWGHGWLLAGLRRLSARWLRGVKLIGRAA